jgi:membrane protease YdiL (CAAX protease family)
VDPVHALFATGLGAYLGVVALWAGSTGPSIVCHGLNNALAVLVASGALGAPPHGLLGILTGGGVAGLALWAARPRPEPFSAGARPATLQPGGRPDDS